ncbi:peptide deformylase [uncultured Acetobacteroides sp.]|uniref:peptide deformylase n=1 Tax=uncultured Acetobacteroides sp. TaxID=1760811 RepID=UPI0029F48309|nr:peptide deformylase [uncultured Acetobacteroides sp.]
MILPIFVYGSPVLKKVAENIDPSYEGLDTFLKDLWETMYHADGVGLAAPQVGKSVRVFVIDGSGFAEDDPKLENFKKAFINPQILERSGEPWPFNEGCLSLPGVREDVYREATVKIKYQDENFVEYTEVYGGIAARIIQHEYDHLDGLLFVDRLSPLRKKLVKGKLAAMAKGKYSADYKSKQG